MQRIGFGPAPDSEVVALVECAARAFAGEGYEITVVEPPFADGDDASAELFYKARCHSEFSKFPTDVRARAEVINRWTAKLAHGSVAELFDAMNILQLQRERMMQLFDDIDYLLLPSVAIPAFDAAVPAPDNDALFAPWSNNFLFNLTEQPAASINCGYTSDGLPVGLQIVGKRFDDAGVLRMARCYEQIRAPQRIWPLAGDLAVAVTKLSNR